MGITKKKILIYGIIFILLFSSAYAQASVDYGGYRSHYQGYGVNTPGGRGGIVNKVINLNDAGAGSFREAVAARPGCDGTPAKCARIVIFETSGTIALSSRIVIDSPYITIAGQTAPSPGITFRDSYFIIDTNNVVIQHIRIRPGPAGGIVPHGIWVRNNATNIVLDHVSISWTVWSSIDLFGATGPVGDVTIFESIVAEALSCSGRLPNGAPGDSGAFVNGGIPCEQGVSGGPHSRAYLFGGDSASSRVRVTMLRSLSANNDERHPAVQGKTDAFIINNLIYNPSKEPVSGIHFSTGYSEGPSNAVVVGNLLKAGPTTPDGVYVPPYYAAEGELYMLKTDFSTYPREATDPQPWTKIYMFGNYYAKHCGKANECLANSDSQWLLAKDKKGWQGINVRAKTPPITLDNLPLSSVLPYTSVEAYVTAHAGARPLDRDAVDKRVIMDIAAGTGSFVNYPGQVGGWPVLAVNSRPLTIPSNPNSIAPGQTFRTNIEMWLEGMARELEPGSVPISNPTVPSLNISSTDPVIHFKFNELSGTTAADSSGLNNHASLLNGASFTAGLDGNAINLDGINDVARVSQTYGLNFNQALTITALVRPQSLSATAYNTIVMKGDQTTRGYGMNIYQGNLNFVKLGGADVRSSVAVAPGAWQRLTITYNKSTGTTQFWVNDVMEHSVIDTVPMNSPTDSDPLLIGSWLTGDRSFFNGQIDEIRIYPRVLSLSELKALPMPSSAPPNNLGDLNSDNKVDLLDVMLILKDFGKTNGFDVKNDVKKDGVINILDVVEIIKNWK